MQTEVLDKPGTDCKTTKTIEVEITQKNADDFSYRYIMEGNKPVCLDRGKLASYIGKKVKLRSPMYCTGDKICNICAGEMNYKLGVMAIGLGCSKIANTLLNLGMKKFHVSNVKSTTLNPDEILI